MLGGAIVLAPRITNHIHRAEGYKYLNQALEILGDQNPEPDFCVAGGIENTEALQWVHQAIEALETAQSAWGQVDAQTLLLLGRAYCLAGRLEEAVGSYEKYTRLRPRNPLGHLELGFGYEEKEEIEKSRIEWEIAQIASNDFYRMGQLALNAVPENDQNALRWFQRAMQIDPKWSGPYYQLALIYHKASNYKEALKILDLGIDQSQMLFGMSNLYYQKGFILQYNQTPADIQGAWLMYEAALAANDFSLVPSQLAAIYHHRGAILAAQLLWQEALQEYQTALQLDPKQYWPHLGMAKALWETGNQKQAFSFAWKATSLHSDPSLAYVYLGDFYLASQMEEKAWEMYLKALEFSPGFSRALEGIEKIKASP